MIGTATGRQRARMTKMVRARLPEYLRLRSMLTLSTRRSREMLALAAHLVEDGPLADEEASWLAGEGFARGGPSLAAAALRAGAALVPDAPFRRSATWSVSVVGAVQSVQTPEGQPPAPSTATAALSAGDLAVAKLLLRLSYAPGGSRHVMADQFGVVRLGDTGLRALVQERPESADRILDYLVERGGGLHGHRAAITGHEVRDWLDATEDATGLGGGWL